MLLVSTKNNGWGVPKGNLMPELGKKKTALEEATRKQVARGKRQKKGYQHPDWILDLYPMKISSSSKWPEMDWRERMGSTQR